MPNPLYPHADVVLVLSVLLLVMLLKECATPTPTTTGGAPRLHAQTTRLDNKARQHL